MTLTYVTVGTEILGDSGLADAAIDMGYSALVAVEQTGGDLTWDTWGYDPWEQLTDIWQDYA